MKLLWASNAPWAPSGYGGQTLQVVKRLKADGHDVAIAANFGLQARVMIDEENLPGVPILPALYDGVGNDILPAHFRAWAKDQPAWLITLYDVWPYQPERFDDLRIASWVPIDHYPVPPVVEKWCRQHRPIAMSRFGQNELARRGIESTYIPHAIEPVFKRIDTAREQLEWLPEHFVVLINAANKGATPMRKAWSEMFGAVAMFMDNHPDVRLHLHTERVGAQAPDLQQILDAWRIDPERVNWSPQYLLKIGQIGPTDLARLYSACDVLLATSMGEGFGIPVVEAQACGLPVIVSNWTAQPELVGGGWLADVQPDWDPVQNAFFCKPIIGSIVEQLEKSYTARGDTELRQAAIAKASEYDADLVYERHWRPFLADLERNAAPIGPVAQPEPFKLNPAPMNRAERRARARTKVPA